MLSGKRKNDWIFVIITTLVCLLFWFCPTPRKSLSLGGPSQEQSLKQRISQAHPYEPAQDVPKLIWQTWTDGPARSEKDSNYLSEASWSTLNPEYQHAVASDDEAARLIEDLFASVPEIPQAYNVLPRAVFKADFFRYLVLLARGGVYTDVDTRAIKPISEWVSVELQPYGLVVGIEADPDRPDWAEWYARRVQFCQWTIASKPGHPVLVDVVAAITSETLERQALGELDETHIKSVMEFTGPAIWTDSVMAYLNRTQLRGEDRDQQNSDFTWRDVANLTERKKISDVVVLPITSFSPGVGHMGAENIDHPLAFVQHNFSGTWKAEDRRLHELASNSSSPDST